MLDEDAPFDGDDDTDILCVESDEVDRVEKVVSDRTDIKRGETLHTCRRQH